MTIDKKMIMNVFLGITLSVLFFLAARSVYITTVRTNIMWNFVYPIMQQNAQAQPAATAQ